MLHSKLVFILLPVLLFSCAKSEYDTTPASVPEVISNPEFGTLQDSETPPFEFESVDKVTIQTDFIPSYPSAFAMDSAGRFYYIDAQQARMVGFEKDGSVIFSVGKDGEGPGDFRSANSMMVRRDTIVVSNQEGTRIDYFSIKGEFLESRQLPSYISFGSIAGETSEGFLLLKKLLMSEVGFTLMALDMSLPEPDTVYTFNVLQAEDIDVPDGISASTGTLFSNGILYVGNYYPYKIREVDLNGKTSRVITRDMEKLVPPASYESGGSKNLKTFGSVMVRAVMEDGLMLASAMYPEPKIDPDEYMRRSRAGNAQQLFYMSTLDFYNAEGTLLYSVENPISEPYPGFGINFGDDLFYGFNTQGDRPVLETYRLIRNN